MNYVLIVLMVTGSLMLGPVIDAYGDDHPWEGGGKGQGAQSVYDSGDPWVDGDPWDDRGKGGNDVFESSYGAGTGTGEKEKGKPAV